MRTWDIAEREFQKGRWEQAEAAYRCVLEEEPENVLALVRLAFLLEKQDEHKEAERFARKAIALGSDDGSAHLILARAAHERKDLDAAEAELRKVIAKDRGNEEALIGLGAVLLLRRAYREVVSLLEPAAKQHPQSTEIALKLSGAQIYLRDYEKAVTRLESVTAYAPENPDAHFLLGFVLMKRKDYATARHHLEEAVSLRPNDFQHQAFLGKLDAKQGNPRRARARFFDFRRRVRDGLTAREMGTFFWAAPPLGRVSYPLLALLGLFISAGLVIDIRLAAVGLGIFYAWFSHLWLWYGARRFGALVLTTGLTITLGGLVGYLWF